MQTKPLNNDTSPILDMLTNPEVLRFILGFVIFLFIVMSSILVFHWHRYGMRARGIVIAEIIFFIVSVVFILGIVFSLLFF